MGEYADAALERLFFGYNPYRSYKPRPKQGPPKHKRKLEQIKEKQKAVPETPEPYRTMLISERANHILAMDRAYPDVGPGMWPDVAMKEAEEQLIRERKISS